MAVRVVFDGASYWVVDDLRKLASARSFRAAPDDRTIEDYGALFSNGPNQSWRESYNNIHPLLLMKELHED